MSFVCPPNSILVYVPDCSPGSELWNQLLGRQPSGFRPGIFFRPLDKSGWYRLKPGQPLLTGDEPGLPLAINGIACVYNITYVEHVLSLNRDSLQLWVISCLLGDTTLEDSPLPVHIESTPRL